MRSDPIELLEPLLAAELEAIRSFGFRRDIDRHRLTTEAVVVYDVAALPSEVARTLESDAPPAALPPALPPSVVLAAAFRPEPQACLPWLRHAAARDPRGALRNLGFWIDEFEARTGLDLQTDLLDALGERPGSSFWRTPGAEVRIRRCSSSKPATPGGWNGRWWSSRIG